MPDREKVTKGLEYCSIGACAGKECPYYHDVMKDAITGCDCTTELVRDAIAMLKAQEEKIRQLESMNVSASGNGTAIGVVKGGLVIQKGQNNKHIVNNGTMTMTFGK